MRQVMNAAFSATVCLGLLLLLGCNDPKKQIAQLEEEKAALGDQLMEAAQDRDAAQAKAAELEQKNANLEASLAQAKQAPPAQPPAPAPMLEYVGAISAVDLGRANKPELSAKAKAQLNILAGTISAEHVDKHVYVMGHTDSDPIKRTKWKDNLELSSQRAMAVVRYLVSRGISQAQLLASGAGQTLPLVANNNKANKAKNRRVEIYVGPSPSPGGAVPADAPK
jgi:chemotaxis protein MotB